MITHKLNLTGPDGRHITTMLTVPSSSRRAAVLIAPPFGLTMRDLFAPTYMLYKNGFSIIRFDPRDHLGQSDGEIANFTLHTLIEDLELVASSHEEVIIAPFSLAALPVLNAVQHLKNVRGIVMVTPVVDVRYTLDAVIGHDYWEMAHESRPPVVRVLGHDVKFTFLDSCKDLGYGERANVVTLMKSLKCPTVLLSGDRDPWVPVNSVEEVVTEIKATNLNVRLCKVRAASHQLTRNPRIALTYFHMMVEECLRVSGSRDSLSTVTLAELIAALDKEMLVASSETNVCAMRGGR